MAPCSQEGCGVDYRSKEGASRHSVVMATHFHHQRPSAPVPHLRAPIARDEGKGEKWGDVGRPTLTSQPVLLNPLLPVNTRLVHGDMSTQSGKYTYLPIVCTGLDSGDLASHTRRSKSSDDCTNRDVPRTHFVPVTVFWVIARLASSRAVAKSHTRTDVSREPVQTKRSSAQCVCVCVCV